MQVVCLPFAGGNETSYERFRPHLPEGYDLVNFTWPGKGSRMGQSPHTDMHALVNEAYGQFKGLVHGPYILYGHSMGALLAHLLLHRLMDEGQTLPERLVVSSFPAPSQHHDRHRRQMDDLAFIAHMKKLGGLPPAVLNEPRLLRVIIPMLRADINAIDSYRYSPLAPYPVPVLAMFGSQEQGLASMIMDWQTETTLPLQVRRMEGDHFFIFPQADQVVELLCASAQ